MGLRDRINEWKDNREGKEVKPKNQILQTPPEKNTKEAKEKLDPSGQKDGDSFRERIKVNPKDKPNETKKLDRPKGGEHKPERERDKTQETHNSEGR